jgi:hypothetical protein
MTDNDGAGDGAWFAPKTFGYGSGLPIAWQGWVLLVALVGAMIGLSYALLPAHPGTFAAAVIGINLLFLPLAAKKTRGGWKWRSGRQP